MYRLILSKKFERDFSKLNKPSRNKIIEKSKVPMISVGKC